MIEEIPTFRATHDPDDIASRNVDLAGWLRRIGGTVYGLPVVDLDPSGCPDAALLISAVAYDATKQRVSFRITGGTLAVPVAPATTVALSKYLLRIRVTLTDGRRYDRSVWQQIAQH